MAADPIDFIRNLSDLEFLSLRNLSIGTEGAITLAASENFKKLESLDLEGNRIGFEGVRALLLQKIFVSLSHSIFILMA